MVFRHVLALFVSVVVIVFSATAHAQAPGEVAPAEAVTGPIESDDAFVVRRYGHHVLAADAAALALAVGSQQEEVVFAYLLTGPVVHLIHGNPGRALGSLGLRVGAPIASAFVGIVIVCSDTDGDELCGLVGGLLGGIAGMVGAVVVDSAVIARERVRATRRFVPVASVTRSGTVKLGIAGEF